MFSIYNVYIYVCAIIVGGQCLFLCICTLGAIVAGVLVVCRRLGFGLYIFFPFLCFNVVGAVAAAAAATVRLQNIYVCT